MLPSLHPQKAALLLTPADSVGARVKSYRQTVIFAIYCVKHMISALGRLTFHFENWMGGRLLETRTIYSKWCTPTSFMFTWSLQWSEQVTVAAGEDLQWSGPVPVAAGEDLQWSEQVTYISSRWGFAMMWASYCSSRWGFAMKWASYCSCRWGFAMKWASYCSSRWGFAM